MDSLAVLDDPAAAIVALDPIRARLLAELAEPGSASSLSRTLGLPRQKVNYHLRALEAHGLVELVEERPRRGLTERVLRASAASYVVSPAAFGPAGVDLVHESDRRSSRYVVALAARVVSEVSDLVRRADAAGRVLPTLAVDAEIRFASAAERAAFTDELAAVVTNLAAKYHDEHARGGRWHRLAVLAHPRPAEEAPDDRT
jgi:DNA-binding transcriptional ArsR family regulator